MNQEGQSTEQPEGTTREGQSTEQPEGTTQEGQSTEQPEGTTQEGQSTEQPEGTTREGQSTEQPEGTAQEGQSTEQPEGTAQEGQSTEQQPEGTTQEGQSTEQPEGTTQEGQSSEQPEGTTQEGQSTEQPEGTAQEGQSSEQQPAEGGTPVEAETSSKEGTPVEGEGSSEGDASVQGEAGETEIPQTEEKAAECIPETTEELNTAAQVKLSAAPKTLGVSRNAAANVVVPDASTVEPESGNTPAASEPEAASAGEGQADAQPQGGAEGAPAGTPALTVAALKLSETPAMAALESTETPATAAQEAAEAPAMASGDADKASAPSALQTLIDNAMKAVTGKLTGRLKVVLAKNTTYEGEVAVDKDALKKQREVADDFELELTTEDAGEDGLQSDGKTTFKGNMVIKGINLIIHGMGIPGKLSMSGAKLTYTGSKAADTVNATIGSGASADIQTGEGADEVSVSASAGGKAKVDSGAGDDTVSAALSGKGSAEISTGAGSDKVKISSESEGAAKVETGEGGDTVTVTALAGTGNVDVATGSGDDTVNIAGGEEEQTSAGTRSGQITVELGEGMDDANVNINVADAVEKVIVKGGEDSDHLHITGKLDEEAEEDQRITGTEQNLTLQGENNALNLVSEDVEAYTDDLDNKRTVKLTPTDTGKIENYIAELPFTDYVINAPADKLKSIVVTTKDGKPLALSGVIIDTDSETGDENKLIINQGTTVDVRGLRLTLKGKNIEVNGTLKADLVQIEALDGNGTYNRKFIDQFAAHTGLTSIIGDEDKTDEGKDWDLINIKDEATIVIGEKAAVYSSGDVLMLARVEQTGGIISILPDVNVVNVKVARANIDILGKVYAGYDFAGNKTRESGYGSVKADAQVETSMGYDEDGKAYKGLPLAVSVIRGRAPRPAGADRPRRALSRRSDGRDHGHAPAVAADERPDGAPEGPGRYRTAGVGVA